jgi:[ribosomal protein S5]-alanine N-acetyltransferase
VRDHRRMETARLLLRVPESSDAQAIFDRYASDAEVTRYLGWPRHRSVNDTRGFLAFSESEWRRWPAGPLVMVSRVDGRLLGGTGLQFETPHRVVTGYVLARDEWGKGYATEALRAMTELAVSLGVSRIHAHCHTQHHASWHVMEKCGFEREGILRRHTVFPNLSPEPEDVLSYARVL